VFGRFGALFDNHSLRRRQAHSESRPSPRFRGNFESRPLFAACHRRKIIAQQSHARSRVSLPGLSRVAKLPYFRFLAERAFLKTPVSARLFDELAEACGSRSEAQLSKPCVSGSLQSHAMANRNKTEQDGHPRDMLHTLWRRKRLLPAPRKVRLDQMKERLEPLSDNFVLLCEPN